MCIRAESNQKTSVEKGNGFSNGNECQALFFEFMYVPLGILMRLHQGCMNSNCGTTTVELIQLFS